MRIFSLILTIFFFFIILNLFSQETDVYEYYKKSNPSSVSPFKNTPVKKNKFDIDFTIGSSFTYFGNNSNGFTSYFMPEIRYSVNPKLSFNAGFIVGNNSFRNVYVPTSESFAKSDLRFTSMYLFTEAEYKMNEKLKISGMILYNMNQNNAFFPEYDQPFNRLEYSFRGEYKLTDYLHFGFEISKRNYSRYRNSSFFGPYNSSPYDGSGYPYMW